MPASASRIQLGSGERRLLLLLSALVAFGPLSIDMYLPSLPAIAADLGASDAQVQRSISGFLVGFCVGMLFYGPLSDRFGRRPVLLAGIALYLFSSLACALADSAGQLVLLRVLQALGGGAASVLARAMVRDLYPLGEAARMLALMHMVTMLAPLAAPLLGGYLMLWAGWRALFVVLALFAGLCLLAVWRVAESHPPERRGGSLAQAFLAYGRLLGDRRALGYVLCMGLAFAGMFAYIAGSPYVFIQLYGIPAEHYGWLFGSNAAGFIVMAQVNARLLRYRGPAFWLRRIIWGYLACGLALLGIASLQPATLWPLLVPLFGCVASLGCIIPNASACAMAGQGQHAGSASALMGSLQFSVAAGASALVGVLHDGTAIPMTLVIAVCGAVATLLAWQTGRLERQAA
ncbi:Bcr/CflA family multidrug efflux MFS transporter [Pseudomonas aeruginosa]|uniref:Bcr/CflA family multidrug efflux MFS transporter n=15 Tax=Gammaproteobacteria TaxID=1236 RepID=UPI0012661AFB|nr:Bcr/CflA family multidrug efflux MFS transporter [Pseudomonas aeruginosa]